METVTFGEILRAHRLRLGFSQEYLAELASLSPEAISALERGHRRAPYLDTVSRLATALELEAGERTRFEQSASRGRARSNRAAIAHAAGTNNLPHPLTGIVGRDEETSSIAASLRSSDERLITIVGPGGIGKTRLAIHIAHAVEDVFAGDVWFIDLSTFAPNPNEPAERIAAAVAGVLGIHERQTETLLSSLTSVVRPRRMVLVIDNCEHVLGGVTACSAHLLRACPGVHVLATSRTPLQVAGERVYRMAPLTTDAALALFRRCASSTGNALPEHDPVAARTVENIVSRLDGIPLAIELAAGRLQSLPLGELHTGLEDRFRLLVRGKRDVPVRHQTLRALVDWSYDGLNATEQTMFQCLSVFYGGCPPGAAADVFAFVSGTADDPRELLSTLVEQSLLTIRSDPQPRYLQLETLQRYAFERLDESGRAAAAARAHAEFYLRFAQSEPRRWRGLAETGDWFGRLNAELANFRAALTWSITGENDLVLGARLIAALRVYMSLVSTAECERWASAALEKLPAFAPPEVRADLALCFQLTGAAQGERLRQLTEDAVAAYAELGLAGKRAHALSVLAAIYARTGRPEVAERTIAEAVELARQLGDSNALAVVLTVQSFVWRNEAERQAIAAEASALGPADPTYELYGQAVTERKRGNHAMAREHMRSAIVLLDQWPDLHLANRAAFELEIAWRSLSLGELEEAQDAAERALHSASRAGAIDAINESLYALATLAAYVDECEAAMKLFGYAEPKIGPRGDWCREDVPLAEAAHARITLALPRGRIDEFRVFGEHLSENEAIAIALSFGEAR